jgi:[ribosomal protein S18]-alanine N-acetyltransferase
MNFIWITPQTGENIIYSNNAIAEFLGKHLENFGDKHEFILKAIEYSQNPSRGGFVLLGIDNEEIIGAVVVNNTGMAGYIPSNILVYIAVHCDLRGKGIGKILMKEAMSRTEGGIALHVEPDNPAKYLYEKLGFTHKYLEMRYQSSEQ